MLEYVMDVMNFVKHFRSPPHPNMPSFQSQAQSERCLQLLSGGGKSQFAGRWQASTISPCMECSKQVVKEEEYDMVGTIGKGSFGSVLLVEERTTGTMFAMKEISKE